MTHKGAAGSPAASYDDEYLPRFGNDATMSDPENADPTLDRRVGDVPVPASLMQRLHAIAELSDEELDWQVRDVELPKGLLHRLRQVVPDEQLDDRLREVPLRERFVARARIIPHHHKRSRIASLALAASLMIAFTIGYGGSLGGILWLVRPAPRPVPSLVVIDQGPLELVSSAESAVTIFAGPLLNEALGPGASDRWPPDQFPLMATIDRLSTGPAGQLFAELDGEWDPAANWMRLRWPIFGYSHPEVETLPDLEMVAMPVASGIQVPLTREFDREFLYSRGTSPPVVTTAGADSCRLTVPLSDETTSWDLLRRELRRDRLPSPEQIRVEHFLAGLEYQLPLAQPGELALRTAAGPSVFNPGSAGLLQISIKAGGQRRRARQPTHLTVALDLSASMDWDQRLAVAREGILRAAVHLHPEDRFSLVVFREEPYLLISEAPIADVLAAYESLDRLQPGGGANLGEVLPGAIAAALETTSDADMQRRLVLITDSPADLVAEVADGLKRMLREASANRFRFDILDLAGRERGDRELLQLAEAGGGVVRQVRSNNQVRWALVEVLQGTPSLVATEAELEVDFNPEAVAAYRLVGHECQTSGGLTPGTVQVDLHTGEEMTALFEVWLYPNDQDDVGTARLCWRSAETGSGERRTTIRISRTQFSTSFEGMPLSLQESAVVAEAAEVLRQSFNFDAFTPGGYRYEPKPRDLRHVLEVADRVNPRVRERADFQRMMGFFALANRITTERPPSMAKSGTRGIIAGRWRESRD